MCSIAYVVKAGKKMCNCIGRVKILDSLWFIGEFGKIGIVVIKNNGDIKAYIGMAKGKSERADALMIANYGVPFYLKTLHMLSALMEPESK